MYNNDLYFTKIAHKFPSIWEAIFGGKSAEAVQAMEDQMFNYSIN